MINPNQDGTNNPPASAPSILVLCYHGANINGNDYFNNDHLALAQDLALLAERGIPIVHPEAAVALARGNQGSCARAVALSFDDGIVLDALDFEHPAFGPQPSFLRVMREHQERTGARLSAVSFVIASPEARAELDRKDFLGLNIWHDEWWRAASESGLISIESHSWDHNHPSLDTTAAPPGTRGNFAAVESTDHCDTQVLAASTYIAAKTGRVPTLFAYPWGQASIELRARYMPTAGFAAGLRGAFSIEPGFVTSASDPWWLPRMVCGQHWRSAGEFAQMIDAWEVPKP